MLKNYQYDSVGQKGIWIGDKCILKSCVMQNAGVQIKVYEVKILCLYVFWCFSPKFCDQFNNTPLWAL